MRKWVRTTDPANINAISATVLFGFGMHCILRGIVLPAIKADLGITFMQSGALLVSSTAGYMVVAMLTSKISEKAGHCTSLSIYACGLMCTALLIALSSNVLALTVFFFITGGCYGGVECVVTALVKQYNPSNSAIILNWVFSFYCLGCIVVALLGGWFVYAGIGWRAAFLVVAVICAIGFVFSLFLRDTAGTEDTAVDLAQLKKLLKNPPFLLSCFIVMLLSGAETSTNNWLTTFLTAGVEINILESSILAAIYFASVYVGRKFFIRLMKHRDASAISAIACLASAILITMVSFVADRRLMLVGIVAFGIAVSPLYPSLIALTGSLASEPLMYSFMFVCISLGNMGVNYLMGAVADILGVKTTFLINAAIFFVVMCLIVVNHKNYVAAAKSEQARSH